MHSVDPDFSIRQIIYALFLSPLRRIPGPLLSKVTYKWLLLVELAGKRTKTVAALHNQYGPVVQLSPEEISFNAIDIGFCLC